MINAELIYNLVLLCFKVRYQKRTTRHRADFTFLLLTVKIEWEGTRVSASRIYGPGKGRPGKGHGKEQGKDLKGRPGK